LKKTISKKDLQQILDELSDDGNLTKKNNVTAFCRCGSSSNKPFCDGSHKRVGFEG